LRSYELVYIISPEVADEDVEAVVDRVNKFITGRGGEVTKVQPWGRKKLAYPINRFREGNYVLTEFKSEPNAANDLEASLRLSEEVLRHLVIRKD